jgi:LTXXQ motif family protein
LTGIKSGNVGPMAEMRKSMMTRQGGGSTLPDRLALEDKLVTAHLAALKKTEDAVARLYGVLSDDQKKIADTIVVGPMGMPMGMM